MTMVQLSDVKARRVFASVSVGLAVAIVVSACGSSSTKASGGSSTSAPAGATTSTPMASSPAAAAGGKTVDIKNFSFEPMTLTVPVGTKVTWKFDDAVAHTVKANDGSFSSPPMKSGQTFSYTFTKAGKFPYICSIHQYMTGTITVS